MKNRLIAFLAAGAMVLAACGGDSPAPTATTTPGATATVNQPATQPTATSAPAATATVEPTATTVVEPTATTEPTATVEPTAAPTEEPTAEPTAEPTEEPTEEPTVNPQNSPLAIPASQLRALGLQFVADQDETSPEGRALLRKHGGKRVINNQWQKGTGTGVYVVSDYRAEFGSADDAAAYYPEALKLAETNSKEEGINLTRVGNAPELGEESAVYRAPYENRGTKFNVYLIAFRVDRYFAGITVLGDQKLPLSEALKLGEAASVRVQRASQG